MRILAVDTTSAFGSIALLDNGNVVEELPMHAPDGFSQTLFDSIRDLLDRHDWTVGSIDCFAAAAGPGSFTGVRVGLTTVKGLAEALSKPALGVSNLEALAACGNTRIRAVIADARRGEVYSAVYDSEGRAVQIETVGPFQDWLAKLPADVTEIISPDFAPFRACFNRNLPVIEQRTLAAAVARVAHLRCGPTDPAAIDANYVRRSDAEMNWKDEPVARYDPAGRQS